MLRLHADRVDLAAREDRLLARFTNAHPEVAGDRVPVVAGEIADLAGLREIGARLAGGAPAAPGAQADSVQRSPASWSAAARASAVSSASDA